MPGLEDLEPRPFGEGEHVPGPNARKDHNTPVRTLDSLRRRAAAIDKALDGHPAPAPADYLSALLTARRSLAPVIDYDSSVEMVRASCPQAVGWRFRNSRGTAVNVGEMACHVAFKG